MTHPQPATGAALPQHVLTILAVQHLAHATRFYQQLLGWSRTVQVASYVEFEGPRGQRLGLYQREGYALNTGQLPPLPHPGQAGATELYLHCGDLPAVIKKARALGARELSPLAKRPWGDEVAYYADGDENVVALARPMAAEGEAKG